MFHRLRRWGSMAVFIGSCCLSHIAHAAPVAAGPSTVLSQSMFSYATVGGGDVVFQLTSNPVAQCHGFWLRASDSGFKNNLAILLSVIQTQGTITVNADDGADNHWSGSSTAYCVVTSLQL